MSEKTSTAIDALIKSHKPFAHDGIYYHRLYLRDGSTVINSSPMSAKIAEWNAMIRLQMLVENDRL